ncbi:MAG: hypothetical protein M3530_06075 [Thermoproteota archaeon]|nr:hypothetical protein [Thermoproteota archaeon]
MTLTNLRRYSILLSKNFGKFEHVNDVSLRKKTSKNTVSLWMRDSVPSAQQNDGL